MLTPPSLVSARSDAAQTKPASGRPRRVLLIEANVDSTVGGSHRIMLEVVAHLRHERFEPIALFARDNLLVPEFEKLAQVIVFPTGRFVALERFPALRRLATSAPWSMAPVRLLQKLYNFARHAAPAAGRAAALLLRERIDLVCINNAPVHSTWLFACKLVGVPCVSYFRATPDQVSAWHAMLFPHYDRIIPSSRAVTEFTRRAGAPVDNFVLIYDGIDAETVRRAAGSPGRVMPSVLPGHSGPVIGVVNNLKHWKGQHIAVEAMRLLKDRRPDLKCLLVGDTAETGYTETVRRMIREDGLEERVLLTGFRSDGVKFLAELDIVLHTSLSSEGFPRVILEAMALGRPLIVSDAGPNVEMVEHGVSGLVVPAGDAAALAARIDEALRDAGSLRVMGEQARERADRLFNIDLNIRATEALFREVLEA